MINGHTGFRILMACAGALATGLALAAADGFEGWRSNLAGQDGLTPAPGMRVTAAGRKSVWTAFRRQFGDGPVQMGRTSCIATNATDMLYNQTFTTTNDVRRDIGYIVSGKGTSARYMTVSGLRSETDLGRNDVCTRALSLVGIEAGGEKLIRMSETVLERNRTSVKGDISGDRYILPFDRCWFVFVDEQPEMDWGHAAMGMFVAEDLSAIAVVYVREPLTVCVDDQETALTSVGGYEMRSVRSSGMLRADERQGATAVEGFPALSDERADASHCYALLVCGGVKKADNHCRYWKEMCFVYNVVRQRYGMPKANVKVLWASGDPSQDLCDETHCNQGGHCRTGFDARDLDDFDRDGSPDIDGGASAANVISAFRWYRENLTAGDQLLVFFTDHGSVTRDNRACICIWGEQTAIFADDLADLTKGIACPVMFAIKTCYSGGMISELVSSAPNRAVATSDGMSSSWGYVWTHNFFGALCGFFPSMSGSLNATATGVNPRAAGAVCQADTDGDGRVSFGEAHEYARRCNPFTREAGYNGDSIDSPQFQQSAGTPSLFLAQYSDATPVIRERVAAPTLDPSSSESRFAPYVVRVACGTAGATIRYTLDGSVPANGSPCCERSRNEIRIAGDCKLSVRAFKSDMDPSETVRAEYRVRKTAPEAPFLTAVSLRDSSTGILVNWIAGEGTDSIDVLRSEDAGMADTKTVASGLHPESVAYADMTARPGRTYYYRVKASNGYGSSLSAVSQGASLQLMPPSGLTAEADNVKLTSADVQLVWEPVAGATHYCVWRVAGDGTTTAVSGWIPSCSFRDTVPYVAGGAAFSYFVKAAGGGNGENASPSCAAVTVPIKAESADWSLVFCGSYPKWVGQAVEESSRTAVKPGEQTEMCVLLKYADGTYETKDFLTGVTWEAVSGGGLALEGKDGVYESFWEGSATFSPYEPPSVEITADVDGTDRLVVVRAFCDFGGHAVSGDFQVVVSELGVPDTLSIRGPDFVVPGDETGYSANCRLLGESFSSSALPAGTEVEWSVIGGSGITLDADGVATGWPVDGRTNATIQARVDTILGPIYATKTVSISPSVVTRQDAVIPPLGGASTNFVGWLPQQTVCTADESAWLSGYSYLGSGTTNASDATWTISLGNRPNGSMISLIGKYVFLSFRADRNPGKDRECPVRLRWDGGGIDFTIRQQEAPTADSPDVRVTAAALSASVQRDGSVVHYATDGEEPSEDSPVLDGLVAFDRNTPVAVKASGDWLQDSETFYGDVEGGEPIARVNVTFDPVEAGVAAPAARTYKVTDTFGELPTLEKEGRYFHGWSLYDDCSLRIAADDYVPAQDAVLYARWSGLPEDEPEWSALPWNYSSSMTGYVKVYDEVSGLWVNNAVVGVVDADGECRGSSKNGFGDWHDERNGIDGLSVFGIYGTVETGVETGLAFRVWIPERGYVAVAEPDIVFEADTDLGTEEAPRVLRIESVAKHTVRFVLGEHGERTGGGALEQTVVQGGAAAAPTVAGLGGYTFKGWDVAFADVRSDLTVTAQYDPPDIDPDPAEDSLGFAHGVLNVEEGSNIVLVVARGNAAGAVSVRLYVTYGSAVESDLDLKKGAVDGVSPRGGLKFPLTLEWKAGETAAKTVAVPVKADRSVETDEKLAFQLADATGSELGEKRVCLVTVVDPQNAVAAKGPCILALAEPASGGTTKGSGVCAPGKKVTLKAAARSGYAFAGWYDGETRLTQLATLVLDRTGSAKTSAAQAVLAVADGQADKTYVARFATAEADAASIRAAVDGTAFADGGGPFATNVWAGVSLSWPVAAEALSATSVKVTGLPSGLKFTTKDVTAKKTTGSGASKVTTIVTNALANTIYGAPKAASKPNKPSEVKVTVTTAGKAKREYAFSLTVDPLPERVVGAFSGGATNGVVGAATLTVASSGKISGKWVSEGKTWTLSAANFGDWSFDGQTNATFSATVTAKSGKTVEYWPFLVGEDGVAETERFETRWSNWKTEPWKSLGKAALNKRTYEVDGVTLTVSANGSVKAVGQFGDYRASATTTLSPIDKRRGQVFVYFPPKPAKGFGGYVRCFEVEYGE